MKNKISFDNSSFGGISSNGSWSMIIDDLRNTWTDLGLISSSISANSISETSWDDQLYLDTVVLFQAIIGDYFENNYPIYSQFVWDELVGVDGLRNLMAQLPLKELELIVQSISQMKSPSLEDLREKCLDQIIERKRGLRWTYLS